MSRSPKRRATCDVHCISFEEWPPLGEPFGQEEQRAWVYVTGAFELVKPRNGPLACRP